MIAMAQKEEEDFHRYKEAHKCGPVHINPEKLGGSGTLQEAREKQHRDQRCSKIQKKLKQDEEKKRRKEQEQMEEQKKKDIQREKAERLEQKKLEDEIRRRKQFELDRTRKTDRFLQQLETKASLSRSVPLPLPNTRDMCDTIVKRNLEEIQAEHKSKNAEFLDRIERRNRMLNQSNASSSACAPAPRLQTSPEPLGEDELHSDPDFDWALMKLMTNFPEYDKDSLEEILHQCSGDYQQAHGLLSQ